MIIIKVVLFYLLSVIYVKEVFRVMFIAAVFRPTVRLESFRGRFSRNFVFDDENPTGRWGCHLTIHR